MKSRPNIMIYGDSRSWGQIPANDNKVDRFDKTIRWPSALANLISSYADVIEECMPSRTIGQLDKSSKAYKGGYIPFKSIYPSHIPLTHVILDFGTNDLKIEYNQSAAQIHNHLLKYITFINGFTWRIARQPSIIYLLPDAPDPRLPWYGDTKEILTELSELCNQSKELYTTINCSTITANMDKKHGIDGVHFDKYHHLEYSWYFKEYFDNIIKLCHFDE
jgi:lysophospholipase L1-like esterase